MLASIPAPPPDTGKHAEHTDEHVEPAAALQPADLGLGELYTFSREAVIVGDLDTRQIALLNPAAERLFGWSAAEAAGLPIDLLIPPAVLRLHQVESALRRRGGPVSAVDSASTLMVPIRTRAGHEIRVEMLLSALAPPPSHIGANYVMALVHDPSDRQQAEMRALDAARADAARQSAEHALEQYERLVADATDDLGADVARLERATRRLARLLADDSHPERASSALQIVEARAARLRRLAEQVATCASIESDRLELRLQRANLVPLVNRVVADVRARTKACRINLAAPQGLTALVDAARFEQVLETLVEQAIRRNPRGCWIDVDLRRPLVGLARLDVHDVGRPISEAQRRRILDVTGRNRGLALARAIVGRHGGTMTIEFPRDGGVRVVVIVPTQRGQVRPMDSSP